MKLFSSVLCALLLSLGLVACGSGQGGVVAYVGGSEQEPLAAAADSPAEWGAVGDFSLTDQNGAQLTLADLSGEPFALAAIFTTCTGPCPAITLHMLELQKQLKDTGVRLVSVSVDPETDTPEVLAAYAKGFGADTSRWSFVTGEEQAIYEFLRDEFWIGAQREEELEEAIAGIQVSHAALIAVVDAEGNKRGWYDGTDQGVVELLAARLRFLDSEAK
jgi:protein SCO1/2